MDKPHLSPQSSILDLRQSTQSTPTPDAKSIHWRPTRRLIKFPIVVLLIATAATAIWLFLPHNVRDPFTPNQRSTLGPLYYPSRLPDDYTIDYKSIDQPDPGIVVFTITSKQRPKLFVSQQATPQNINMNSFYGKMKQITDLKTSIGTGKIGLIQDNGTNQKIASVTTTSIRPSWVLINTSSDTPDQILQEVAQNFSLSQ